jgi:PAS domain-containing protein
MRAMTPCQASPDTDPRPEPSFWYRVDTAQVVADFADPFDPPLSQRQYAQEHGIPRTTLGYWLRKDFPDHLDAAFVSFCRCPAGQAFLRRLILALLLVFHHRNPCGIRPIGHFLELVELDHFVGSSYGALYDLDLWLQNNLDLFAGQERQRLAAGMASKDIVLCPDENFHGPHVCLVAIEPVSNFILVEAYREQRDSVTWAKAIRDGINGLPVHVVNLTSDQASGLVCCATKELQAAHQPDLLHLQHDLAKPLLLPLARPIHQAEKDLQKLKQQEQRLEQAEEKKPGSVTIEKFVDHIHAEEQVKKDLEECQEHLHKAVEQMRGVSAAYHPFDRETGQPVLAEPMQARLSEPLQRLQEVVEEAGLSGRAHEAIQKARGWVVLLVGCIAWFWTLTRQRLEQLDLSEEAQRLVEEYLIASAYWEMASKKEKDPEERKRLKELAQQLREKAWAKGGVLARLTQAEKQEVERVARQCAELFQRSSSCVEGRNGRLALFHHGQTRLSERKLKALTAVHNYVVRRADGTTAAERFFGQPQRDAFTWLLARMPDLPHPAAKRRNPRSDEGSVAA